MGDLQEWGWGMAINNQPEGDGTFDDWEILTRRGVKDHDNFPEYKGYPKYY